MEGIDTELVNKEFEKELGVYQCDLALAIGYHDVEGDYNGKLPKSRRDVNEVFVHI
jgi:nitroreductase/dihydropteridine reductase